MTRSARGTSAPRSGQRSVRALAVALVCASAVAACGSGPDSPPASPPPSAPAAPPASTAPTPAVPPSAAALSTRATDALGRTTTATVTGVTDRGAAPQVTLREGVVDVSAELTDGGTLALRVEGARWTAFRDGSATLFDDDGDEAPRVGGTDPAARDAAGPRRTSTHAEDDGRTLVVTLEPRTTTAAPQAGTISLSIAPRALESATWADDVEGGRSLQVDPTAFGRSGSTAALEAVRAELAAVGPEARTTVMDHQLRCHALGAPGKDTWNLEPWRPELDYLAYLLARCNPTSRGREVSGTPRSP